MELYKSILIKVLEESEIIINNLDKIIENRCYKALGEIVNIIKAEEYDDAECFIRIEKIIAELEGLGLDGGFRHDFG